MQIAPLDLFIIILYFVSIVGLGCWAGLRRKKSEQASDYFLAGRSLTWPIIGLALFSTNISTVHLVSLAEEGYTNGLAYGNFEWMAPFTLIILALFFAPFYIRANVATLPDFLEKRYSRASRDWLAVLSIISAIFIHIGFSLYAGAVVLEGMFGLNKMTSIVLTAVLTGVYTIVGGLMAVVFTESVQTIILLAGAILLTAIGYAKVGGWEGLSSAVEPVKLTVLRPHGDASGLPWYAVLMGYPIIGIWYWCTEQTIVQRGPRRQRCQPRPRWPLVCRIYQNSAGLHLCPARPDRRRPDRQGDPPAAAPKGRRNPRRIADLFAHHRQPVCPSASAASSPRR